ncbi:MAG: MarR family transcriptional regulator [Clostridia bacterium]|nr:MarR family transcriptional regulator [Clostridia bacterium]
MSGQAQYESLKLSNQLCFPLYAASRKVVSAYTPLLKPLGITYTQYIVFMVLWEKRETTVRELGQTLLLDSGTLTPVLKKLESEGYITRCRDGADERVVTVHITDAGMALREKAATIPAQMASCADLTPEEAAELYRILYKILE